MLKNILIYLLFSSPFLFIGKSGHSLDLLESVNMSKNNDSLFLMANTRQNIIKENENQESCGVKDQSILIEMVLSFLWIVLGKSRWQPSWMS